MMIKDNSKYVRKNDLFICTHSDYSDKHDYINDAIEKKVGCIIVDKNLYGKGVPTIRVNNTNDTFAQIYEDYFNHPLDDIILIGVTGTDGKTSVSLMLYQLLNIFDTAAYIGTNGFIYNDNKITTNNTTPTLDNLYKFFDICRNNNIKYIVMEVSSEGLLHNRCHNIVFNRSIFTNITIDHLNIHKNFNNYLNSKLKLFKQTNGFSILNIDDSNYVNFKKNCKNSFSYGLDKKADFRFFDIQEYEDYTIFKLKFKNNIYTIKSPYLGKFNVYNIVSCIALLYSLNKNIDNIINMIKYLKPIDGRVNIIKFKNYEVVLDYAHTTYATYNILNLFSNRKKGRLITVVGCAGGREKSKRKEIGSLVCKYSDKVYFTTDDPRYENPYSIFKDMISDNEYNNYYFIKNRKKAIYKALDNACDNDIVLILGKGIDNYMAIKNKYKKYCDLDVINKYKKKKKL